MKYSFILICSICFVVNAKAQTVYSIDQLVDSAMKNNIVIRNAYREIESAEEMRKETNLKYYPSVSGTALWFKSNKDMVKMNMNISDYIPTSIQTSLASSLPVEMLSALGSPTSISMMNHGAIASVTAVQPVYTGGVITNANRLAEIGKEAKSLQLNMSEKDVEKTVTNYFWQLVSLKNKVKTIEMAQSTVNEICRDVEIAVNVGVTLKNDLLQVQLRRNEQDSQMLKVKNGISVVKMLLAQYCGLTNVDFDVKYDEKLVSPIDIKTDHSKAVTFTTEYQLLGKQVEVAELQRKMAYCQNLPSVAVGAGVNYHNLLDNDRVFGMVFATLSIPISDWWSGNHNVRRKKIEYEKALDEMNDKSELLKIKMDNAWNNLQETWLQMDVAKKSIEQSEENLRLNRICYKAGTATLSDLMQAQSLNQQALDQYYDAYIDYQIKLLEYKQAIGL